MAISGLWLAMAVSTPQVLPSKPFSLESYPISLTTLRTRSSKLTKAWVVISPSSITNPVLVAVSQATRERGSCSRQASKTASEIWSHILSGCPSDTDSDENISFGEVMNVLLIGETPLEMKLPLQTNRKGNYSFEYCSPLISQDIRLSELAPFQL